MAAAALLIPFDLPPTMADTATLAEASEVPWLSHEKIWDDAPPKIRHMGQAMFLIPELVQNQLLPPPTLSIREMLQFALPRHTNNTSNLNMSAFFRKDMPGPITDAKMIGSLHHLPVPLMALVRKLECIKHQAWLNGYQSIIYAHLDKSVQTFYPLWVLTFWGEVVQHRILVREPWLKSMDWLQVQTKQKKSIALKHLAEDVNVMLTDLPWGGNKHGLSDSEPIYTMHRYLGTSWTSISQQNDMLELLRRQITLRPDLIRSLAVEGVILTETIIAAACTRDKYLVDRRFAWIRHLGEAIILTNRSLLTVAHIVNHRVALVIDVKKHVIRFGDSFGATIPGEMLSAYRWWLAQHTKATFGTETLPMTPQTDTHSCGYLANNGLHHFAIPDLFPLIQPGVQEGASARITVFKSLAEHILEQVSPSYLQYHNLADRWQLSEERVVQAYQFDSVSEPEVPLTSGVCGNNSDDDAAPTNQKNLLTNDGSLKCAMEHDSACMNGAATLTLSPKKKRIHMDSESRDEPYPLPVLDSDDIDILLTSRATSSEAIKDSDMFGSLACLGNASGSTVDHGRRVDLRDYWKVETAEEKEQRHHCEWERLERDHEARAFQDEQNRMEQHEKVRMDNRERAQRCRDLKRERKIEAGWVPGQKRVSVAVSISMSYKTLTSH